MSVALTASAVLKGLGLAPQAVVETYEELCTSIRARNRHVTLSGLARMEERPQSVRSSGWLAEELQEVSSVDKQKDVVARAKQQLATTRDLLTQHAVAAADSGLMILLGSLARDLREFVQCEDWYAQAAELGDIAAVETLAAFLEDFDRPEEAEQWQQRAAALGSVPAMIVLARQFDKDENRRADAEDLYRRAAAAGDAEAMAWLGDEAQKRGAVEEAQMWHYNAFHAGHPNGALLLERFHFGWDWIFTNGYIAASEAGDAKAMRCRALNLHKSGDNDAAEQWHRRAIDAGDPLAMAELSELLRNAPGRAVEAEEWCRKAADTGHMPAVVGLGHFLHSRRANSEAAQWYRRAAAAGYLAAQASLEHLESCER
ncbi:hypothetical protein OH799_04810 [Nocardia sp. NBC_00881]|uniref:hypothetical protein n=1 Tax=Nocardia sp. NBC_00881 TaxID=2975995 RepID=UPI00386C2253|nr:hypothetical protein OH799_04810 [Nocardia sp. NBC_00881]